MLSFPWLRELLLFLDNIFDIFTQQQMVLNQYFMFYNFKMKHFVLISRKDFS